MELIGNLLILVTMIWALILPIDVIRGKFLHKGKKKRTNIFILHTFILLFTAVSAGLMLAPDDFNFLEHRFSTAELNVRSGPGTDYDITKDALSPGEEFYVMKDSAGWVAISKRSNDSTLYGWVSKSFTDTISNYSQWRERKEKLAEATEKAKQKAEEAESESMMESVNIEADAIYMSKEYVKTYLKAPSTADFPWTDYKFVNNYGNVYTIQSYVDSQNEFGAMLRATYICQMWYNKNKDTWKLMRLVMNGEQKYPSE